MAAGQPEGKHHHAHQDHLVEIVPALDEGCIKKPHYVFVVQAAAGSCQGGDCNEPDPFVVYEVHILFFAGTAQKQEGNHGENHAAPLPGIQPFSEDEHCSE